ncbi:energy-coupling factor transporter transmembrane component T [Lachnoclostridium sp. Marseille-P6806]|uniref:energy-coupling factor transporter transmembrane component T n=1 Tax=Lachnoclostridium sp. Marseille-P6806 TaxID=2364793 RepID=UPI001031711F|nr:energy-coupling factor transporter transmembrane component T [Lachnoclostridium sp. Marseille-P6806]
MKLDVRCKFLILIAISVIAFSTKDVFYGSLVFSLVCLLTFLLGQGRKTVKYIITYLVLVAFILLAKHVPTFLRGMILMIVLCIRMCMPIALYGQTFMKTTPVSEMVTGLYALHIPRGFVITFAVAMRFFPTAKEEFGHIRDAMTLRGINLSVANVLRRPALVFEGLMTPLLVRSFTIAEELSAASITRGLDNPAPRTAFVRLHVTMLDIAITILFVAALFGVLWLRENGWGWWVD